ncbi:hypothetical protein M3Y99_01000600 [Aphelenchoides fujianensis]|nr:hypothetical protein M3Y99_01000600 [Aphelenchoides fujianensis]
MRFPAEHRVFWCKLAAIMYALLIAYDAVEAEKKAAGGEATPTAAGGSKQPVEAAGAAGGSKQAA